MKNIIAITAPLLIVLSLSIISIAGAGNVKENNMKEPNVNNTITLKAHLGGLISYINTDNEEITYDTSWKGNKQVFSGPYLTEVSDVYSLSDGGSYLIKTDGTVWKWEQMLLDEGKIVYTKIPDIENCIKLSNWGDFTLALLSDGSVMSWGSNGYGELGDGTNEDRNTPQRIESLSNIIDIAVGMNHALAVRADGTVFAWGDNSAGQLGNGKFSDGGIIIESDEDGNNSGLTPYENNNSNIPIQVPGLDNVCQVFAGNTSSYALENDGTLWEWGICLENDERKASPIKMEGLTDVVKVLSAAGQSMALTADGYVWEWQPSLSYDTPQKRDDIENVIDIELGNCAVAVLEDGSIWQWYYTSDSRYNKTARCILEKEDLEYGEVRSVSKNPYKPSTWAEEEVAESENLGLVPDCMKTKYEFQITRLEFCKLAVLLLEKKGGARSAEDHPDENPYQDTDDSDVLIASQLGIVNGKGNQEFDPSGYITREEAATMLYRTAKVLHYDLSNGEMIKYSDFGEFSQWAKDGISYVTTAVEKVSGKKVMGGTAINKFSPKSYYTREQAFITMKRLYNVE